MSENSSSDIEKRKQQVSSVFDGAAPTYDRVGPRFFSHFGRRLVEIAQIPSGSKALDVATGRGAVLFPAAEAVGQDGSVTGIDLSEKMVQETNKELSGKKVSQNIEIKQMDAEHLQFPDDSFDHVLCGFAIFFFPRLDQAMAEFRRVLKPSGQLCVSTFDKLFYEQSNWFYTIVEKYLPPESGADQSSESNPDNRPVFDTPEGLTAIMNGAGFEDIQVFSESVEFVYRNEDEFWSTLWSHGRRRTLERIKQEKGAEGLEEFKSDVFKTVSAIKQADGLHRLFSVHVCKATKPAPEEVFGG